MSNLYFDGSRFDPLALAADIHDGLAVGPDGSWWAYSGGVWSAAPDEVRRRVVNALGSRYKTQYVPQTEDIVMHGFGTPEIPASPVGDSEWSPRINLLNGMYNWITGTLSPHDPAALSTIQFPLRFDPEATDTPVFDKWLAQVAPGEVGQLALEMLGYSLMLGNPLQQAFLLLGEAGTGKSTFLRLIEAMLGEGNYSAVDIQTLAANRFAAASLYGKVANISADLSEAYLEDTGMFKRITGGDTIVGERKYAHAFEFRPFAVPMFSANKVWRSADTSEGYFRRWVVLPFNEVVYRPDTGVVEHFDEAALQAEAPGIFLKAMDALRGVRERHGFSIAGAAREAKDRFRQASDTVYGWLAQDPAVDADKGHEGLLTARAEVYARYQLWTEAQGMRPLSAPRFYESLEGRGYHAKRLKTGRFILGIQLLPEMSEAL